VYKNECFILIQAILILLQHSDQIIFKKGFDKRTIRFY